MKTVAASGLRIWGISKTFRPKKYKYIIVISVGLWNLKMLDMHFFLTIGVRHTGKTYMNRTDGLVRFSPLTNHTLNITVDCFPKHVTFKSLNLFFTCRKQIVISKRRNDVARFVLVFILQRIQQPAAFKGVKSHSAVSKPLKMVGKNVKHMWFVPKELKH